MTWADMTTEERREQLRPVLLVLLTITTIVFYIMWRDMADRFELQTEILEGNILAQIEVKACIVKSLALRLDEGQIRTGRDLETAWIVYVEDECAREHGTTAAFPEDYQDYSTPG